MTASFIELNVLRLLCANCNTPTIIDLAVTGEGVNPDTDKGIGPHAANLVPRKCSKCEHQIPHWFGEDVRAFRELYSRNRMRHHGIEFLVRA